MIDLLRRARWLNAERLRGYLVIYLVAQALAGVWAVHIYAQQSVGGRPVGTDFLTFWSAARVAVQGHAADAYNDVLRVAAQREAAAMADGPGHYAYWYPPVFLLLTLPLGLIGYLPAMVAFLLAEWAVLAAVLRRIAGGVWPSLALAASPAVFMNFLIGQNALLTAACFGGALLWLEARPVAAGLLLSLLVCKPQFALVLPVALAVAGRWRAFFACGAGAVFWCVLSWALLGSAAWAGFLQNSSEATATLQNFAEDFGKIQSVFAGVRLWGGGLGMAYGAQALTAVAALAGAVLVVRRRPGAGAEIAATTTASLLVTPYMFDYDLACLLVPLAWLLGSAARGGWRDWEKLVVIAAYFLPLVARGEAQTVGIPLVPPVLFALLVVIKVRSSFSEEKEAKRLYQLSA
jgi:hypothetical protein